MKTFKISQTLKFVENVEEIIRNVEENRLKYCRSRFMTYNLFEMFEKFCKKNVREKRLRKQRKF